MPIEEDELAGHDDHALGGVTREVLVTVEQQLDELAGIAGGRRVGQPAVRVEGDARLRGVGDDEAHLRLFGECQESLELRVGIEGAADDIDARERVDGSAILPCRFTW